MKFKLAGKKLFFIFIYTIIASLKAYASYEFLSDYMQQIFAEESAIPVRAANYVLQTKDGFIWIASYEGLYRYDGTTSIFFNKKNYGFPTANINILFEDSNSNLWIGTNDAGIVLYKNGIFTVFGVEKGLPSNSIRAIDENADGSIYVATAGGLAKIKPDNSIEKFKETDDILILDVICAGNGEVWSLHNDGTINIIVNNAIVSTYEAGYFEGLIPRSIFKSQDKSIYIGTTQNKIIKILPQASKRWFLIDTHNYISIQNFYEDNENRIWFCSSTGLGYIKKNKVTEIDGLAISNSLSNIIQDSEGSYWITSSRQGILQLTRSKFHNISLAANIPANIVNTTKIYENQLYIGTDQGLFIVEDNKLIENKLSKMLKNIRIRCIITDSDGNLIICTYQDYGVVFYNKDKESITTITPANGGLVSLKTRCAIETSSGSIIVGTNNGISILRNKKVIRNYTSADGIDNPYILSLEEGKEGVIYAGSDGGGIYSINSKEIKKFNEFDGLPSGIILRMAYDRANGGMWVSTGNSLCFWDFKTFKKIPLDENICTSIFDIKFLETDILFLNPKGLYIFNLGKLITNNFEYKVLRKFDGLISSATANSWNDMLSDGIWYISCSPGVLSINTRLYHKNMTIPKAAVTSVIIDDVVHNMPESVIIPRNSIRVEFKFALLTYASMKGNSITYMLEGFDTAPKVLSINEEASSVSYTNLKGGEYNLRLIGINSDGVKSEELIIPLKKELIFTEQPLVKIGIIFFITVFVIFLVLAYVKYKTKAILLRQNEYREITKQAIQAIADTIDAKDKYTAGHSRRVAEYSVEIGKRLGFSENDIENLYYAALLHDIGKIGIPDDILNKKAALNNDEFIKIQEHVQIGGSILNSITIVENIATGARYHHERYDGKGYVYGLSGENIPVFARIICVADSFDAMSNSRPYRKTLSKQEILQELNRCSGKQFDPKIVSEMLNVIEKLSSENNLNLEE